MSDPKAVIDSTASEYAPDAAKFGRGGSTLADVKKATKARDNLVR